MRRFPPKYRPNLACSMFVCGVALVVMGMLPGFDHWNLTWFLLHGTARYGPGFAGSVTRAGWLHAVGWPLMVISVTWRQVQE